MRYTVNDLQDAMVIAIQGWTQNLRLPSSKAPQSPTETPIYVQPHIWPGKIPANLAGFLDPLKVPVYPCVLVEAYKGGYNRTSGHAILRIVVGTFDQGPDRRSWRDNQLIIQLIIRNIYENPVIGGSFLHIDDPEVEWTEWDDPEDVAPDHSFGMILVPYGLQTPSPNEPRTQAQQPFQVPFHPTVEIDYQPTAGD
jgi:hypothetical protein